MNSNKKNNISDTTKHTSSKKIWNPFKILKAAMKTSSKKEKRDGISNSGHARQPPGLVARFGRAKQPPRSPVRFAQSDTVYDGLAMDEYTPEEIGASWFSNVENEAIHQRCKKVIRQMEKQPNQNKYCSRGLESMTGSRMDLKQQNRLDGVNAVLDLQDAQWKQGYDDQEQIARHYQKVSLQCQIEASCIAELDELVVLKQNNKKVEQHRRSYMAVTA
jgi:hypothetical protein